MSTLNNIMKTYVQNMLLTSSIDINSVACAVHLFNFQNNRNFIH